jgi:hypothetical protein
MRQLFQTFQSVSNIDLINSIRKENFGQVGNLADPIVHPKVKALHEPFFREFPTASKLVLRFLLDKTVLHNGKILYYSWGSIAKATGLSRSSVQKIMRMLQEYGLIAKIKRNYKTCYYRVSSFFFEPHVRKFLSILFVGVSLFLPVLLMSFPGPRKQQQNEQCAQVVNNGNYLNILSLIYHSQPTRSGRFQNNCERYAQATGAFPQEHRIGIGKKSRSNEAMQSPFDGVYNPIRQSIRDLKSLQLTEYGQIELESFPDTALEFAEKKMASVARPRDRFKLFMSFCNVFCRDNKIVPNWRKVYSLREMYPKPADAMLYIEPKESPQTAKAVGYNKPYTRSTIDDELNAKVKADAERRQREWELSRGILTDEDRFERLIKPNLNLMPSWAVADLVARGKLPDCPETQARIAQELPSTIHQKSTQPNDFEIGIDVVDDMEDHSTEGIFDW